MLWYRHQIGPAAWNHWSLGCDSSSFNDAATSFESYNGSAWVVLRYVLAIDVVRVFFLVLGCIVEHDVGQVVGGRRAMHRPAKTELHHPRQETDMVDVSMRQHDGVNLTDVEGVAPPSSAAASLSILETVRNR